MTPEVLQGLLGSIGDGVILTDQDERITFINPAAMRILGCEGENVRGMECMDVCRFIRIGSNRPYKDPLKKAMEGRSSVGLSRNVGIYRGSEPVYLSATCSPIVHIDGRVPGCSVILRDVSRMRRLYALRFHGGESRSLRARQRCGHQRHERVGRRNP